MCWGDYNNGGNFDNLVALAVYFNVLSMCLYAWTPPAKGELPPEGDYTPNKEYHDALDAVQYAFMFLFIIEAFVRLVALGRHQYWASHWNRFDLVIAVLTFAAFLVEVSVGGFPEEVIPPTFFRVIRALRIFPLGKAIRR